MISSLDTPDGAYTVNLRYLVSRFCETRLGHNCISENRLARTLGILYGPHLSAFFIFSFLDTT